MFISLLETQSISTFMSSIYIMRRASRKQAGHLESQGKHKRGYPNQIRTREIRFKRGVLVGTVRLAIDRVLHYRTAARGEKPPIQDIFCTESGKLLGSQVNGILDFTKKGQILLILLPLTAELQKVQGLLANGTYREKLASILSAEDAKKLKAYEVIMKDMDSNEPKETAESLMAADDRLWYYSLITFSVYAYVDVYTRNLIKEIAANPSLCKQLEQHLLVEAKEHQDVEDMKYVTAVSDMTRYGVSRRLNTIEKGLSIDKTLSVMLEPEILNLLRSSFSKIMRIRHKIAHRNPKLHEEEYSYGAFEDDLDENELDLDSTISEISEEFGFLKPIFGSIKDLVLATSERILKTMTIVHMVVLYPALLDAVIHEPLRN